MASATPYSDRTSANPQIIPIRELAILYVAAVVLRLLNLWAIPDPNTYSFIEDSPIYWDGAAAWLESGFFSRPNGLAFIDETERVPGYFLFLVPFRWLLGDSVLAALIGQSFLDAGSCVLIALIGGTISKNIGLLAGAFAAVWPNFVIHSGLILTDSLFLFFFCCVLLFAASFMRTGGMAAALMSGLFCGLALMTRPIALPMIFAMAVAAPFVVMRHDKGIARAAITTLIFLAVAILPATPLIARNVTEYNTWQLTSQTGTHMLSWVVGYTKAISSGRSFDDVSRELLGKLEERHPEFKEGTVTPFESSRYRLALAKDELKWLSSGQLAGAWAHGMAVNFMAPAISTEPRVRSLNQFSFANSTGDNVVERVWNFLSDNNPNFVLLMISGIVFAVICAIFQLIGLIHLFRVSIWHAVFGSLVVAYFLLANGPIGGPKYRLPIEPVLIILQSVSVLALIDWARARWRRA